MAIQQKYQVIDTETGALDRSVFVDEKIFGRAWLMLTHESLIPNVNDWRDIYIDPITAKFEGTATFRG